MKFSFLTKVVTGIFATTTAAVSAVGSEYPYMDLTLLSSHPDARCLDGSPAGYYFAPGSGSGTNKFYIEHQGGGWCETAEKCLERSRTSHGSSNSWPMSVQWRKSELFSTDPAKNPLIHNWNKVYIRYCDGASFSSTALQPLPVDGTNLYFRGLDIVKATMDDLVNEKGLYYASEAIIGGCSAGGLATLMNCDRWAEKITMESPKARVSCAPESGFFLNFENANKTGFGGIMKKLKSLHTLKLPLNCLEKEQDGENKCLSPAVMAKHVNTPLFVIQSKFDSWAKGPIALGGGSLENINSFGDFVLEKVQETVLTKPENGAFIDSCTRHCGGFDVKVDGIGKAEALAMWHQRQILGADATFLQDRPYPCSDCCGGQALAMCYKDQHNQWMLFPSDAANAASDWFSDWGKERLFESPPLTKDTFDDHLEVRLRGKVSVANNVANIRDTFELFVENTNSSTAGTKPNPFDAVEITAKFKYVQDGKIKPGSGLTIVGPTNFQGPGDNSCNARSYRAQIRRIDGRVAFQKQGSKGAFTARSFGSFDDLMGSTLSEDWISAKFVILPLSDKAVKLDLYIDVQNGKGWQLAHSMVDEPGEWATVKDIPSDCVFEEGDVVRGGGQYVGLYNVGDNETMVSLKHFSVRNILPDMYDTSCGATPMPSLRPSPLPSGTDSMPTAAPHNGAVAMKAMSTILVALGSLALLM